MWEADGPTPEEKPMPATPTGRLVPQSDTYDVVLTRTFDAPIASVWAAIRKRLKS